MMPRRFILGERAINRLFRRPAIALTSPLTKNKPVSANRVMMSASDLSHLTLEAPRIIAMTSGYPVDGFRKNGDAFALIRDGARTLGATDPAYLAEIPWDPRNSQMFGPVEGIDDCRTNSADPQRTYRQVNFEIEVDIDAANVQSIIYFAITDHSHGLSLAAGDALAFFRADITGLGAGVHAVTATLLSTRPTSPAPITNITGRPASYGALGSIFTRVRPYYAWIGWRLDNGSNNKIVSFSITETREACITTIIAPTAGTTLPRATIDVASTVGAPAFGTVYIVTSLGEQIVQYQSIASATQFGSCSGGTGVMALGASVEA